MNKIFKYFTKIFLLTISIYLFTIIFAFFNVPKEGISIYLHNFLKFISITPIDKNIFNFENRFYLFFINFFLWSNIFFLFYLILRQILKNKLNEKQRYKLLYNFVLVSTITILIRQIIVIFHGVELFDLIGDIFSTFILFLYIIFTALVESFIIPIFNIFHLHKKNVDFGKYHKAIVVLNIIFLIRALFYSVYYLISFFDY